MADTPEKTVLVFSHGTLQDKRVQVANFDRELEGRYGVLPGYLRAMIPITDPQGVASTGTSHYANAEPSPNSHDTVAGTVFEITEQELAAADRYEAPAYVRGCTSVRSNLPSLGEP